VLFQLHWQNRENPRQTDLVGQFESDDGRKVEEWARELVGRRRSECPDGWVPMLCDETSDYFVLAAAPTVDGGQEVRG